MHEILQWSCYLCINECLNHHISRLHSLMAQSRREALGPLTTPSQHPAQYTHLITPQDGVVGEGAGGDRGSGTLSCTRLSVS